MNTGRADVFGLVRDIRDVKPGDLVVWHPEALGEPGWTGWVLAVRPLATMGYAIVARYCERRCEILDSVVDQTAIDRGRADVYPREG